MTSHPAIVVCGHDPTLLMTRESLLLQRGYRVRPRQTVASVIREMQEETPELVVICHTFSASEAEAVMAAAHAAGCGKLMLLSRRTRGADVVAPGVWQVGSMDPRMFLLAVGEELADERRWNGQEAMRRVLPLQ